MNPQERAIFERYAHWQPVLGSPCREGIELPSVSLELGSCNGEGCVADSCNVGGSCNGHGCLADSCHAGGGDERGLMRARAEELGLR